MCLTESVSKQKKIKKFAPHFTPLLLGLLSLMIAVIIIFKNDIFVVARGPKGTTTTSSVAVVVATPNGGEKFYQGQANTISWKGGYRSVAIGLATADADTNHAIGLTSDYNGYLGTNDGGTLPTYNSPQTNGYTGYVIGFINTRENGGYYLPNSSTTWDGLKVCNFHLNLDPDVWCKNVAPGNYKIFVWSEGEGGQSRCIASGNGPTGKYTTSNGNYNYGCNWDLSNQAFTIASP